MSEKDRHITGKVIWGYLFLLLMAMGGVAYVYTEFEELAVEEVSQFETRKKTILITNTLSMVYESDALNYFADLEKNNLNSLRLKYYRAVHNLDSLRTMLTENPIQQKKVDTIQYLLERKKWNTVQLLEILQEWNGGQIYLDNIERVIANQDSILRFRRKDSIPQKIVYQQLMTKQDTIVIPKIKKGFFGSLGEVLSSKGETDTTWVFNSEQKLITDTVKVAYNLSDTIIQILRTLQTTMAGQQEVMTSKLFVRANNLRYNNTILSNQINQMLHDIENESAQESMLRMEKRQSMLRETTRLVAYMGLIITLVAIVFLVIIVRDISKTYYYRRQLEKANVYARELLNTRENLIMTISHDIRAPISSILGFIELLLKRNPDERQRYYLDNMTISSRHVLSLVNDLLDFHRLESGKMEIHPVPFSVSNLINEIYTSFKPMARSKGLTLDLQIKPDFMQQTYMGDTNRIRQVINNLLSNAIKFTSEGRVFLHVGILEKDEQNFDLVVTVSDEGPGIPESERERIFCDFARLEEARLEEGFGLGLPITRRLVNLLHGTLDLHTEVGIGSDFVMTIPIPLSENVLNPVTEEDKKEADEENATPSIMEKDRTVYCLLIDDDPIQLALTEELLKRSNVEVVCISNPQEVLDVLKNISFDAVITDIQMPGVNGFKLLKMIRESGIEGMDQVPVIALSASVANESDYYKEKGFTAFLNKPFTAVQLINLLNNVLTIHLKPVVKMDFSTLTAFAGEDQEASVNILKTFSEETSKSVDSLKKALENKDRNEVSRLAHKLIPLFTMIGTNNLVQKLRILEKDDEELTNTGWNVLLSDVIVCITDINKKTIEEYKQRMGK